MTNIEKASVKIKICGLYRAEDIEAINRYRPDYAGFVFYPPSHRYVSRLSMQIWRERLDKEIPAVGVFVDSPEKEVADYGKEGLVQVIQLHGHESEEYIQRLRKLVPDCEIWKAFWIRTTADLAAARESSADRVLLDNGYGTGQCFDWKLMEGCGLMRSFLLAGGLNAENIGDAARRFSPWGLDVSSGAETNRKKDPEKIQRIIETVRNL
ncbi:MAG: phosphoribosylanthranilate isomerase [Lachnospiraceae bacterium]|nr:phosphoribosylanthranilate isomerase [Lachnospiraceae bacterium]